MKFSKLLALSLCLCLLLSLLPAGAAATDGLDATTSSAVATLTTLGVVNGYPDGSFHPDESLNRAQFCKMAVVLSGSGDTLPASVSQTLFDDVPASHWAVGYIQLACEKGLVNGYGNGRFGPDDAVTLSQAAKVLLGLLGYSAEDIGPFYPEDYLSKAASLGLLNGLTNSDHSLTRAEAAQMLYNLLKCETKSGQTYCATLSASVKEDVVLLDAAEGEFTDGKALTDYTLTVTLAAELENRRGTLLLDKKSRVIGFVPEETQPETLALSGAESDALTAQTGRVLTVEEDTPVVLSGALTTYADAWYALKTGDSVNVYWDSGDITLLVVTAAASSAASQVLGRIDSAAPSLKAASTVTLSGCTLPVSVEGKAALKSFSAGEVVLVTLDRAGKVTAVTSGSGKTLVGKASVSGKTATVSLPGGTISGPLTNATAASLSGSLVNVRVNADGELTLTALTTRASGDSLNLRSMTLGSAKVSAGVTVYERVGSAEAVEIALSDILLDTVSGDSIEYFSCNASGEVDLILLQSVTGNRYTYGILSKTTRTSGSGSMTASNAAVSVENKNGSSTAYITGKSFSDGAFGGVAGNSLTGKTEDINTNLVQVENLSRADFSGSDSIAGMVLAEDLQVFNAATEQWVTLSQARAWSNTFTAYLDKAPEEGGQVRILVAE